MHGAKPLPERSITLLAAWAFASWVLGWPNDWHSSAALRSRPRRSRWSTQWWWRPASVAPVSARWFSQPASWPISGRFWRSASFADFHHWLIVFVAILAVVLRYLSEW